MTDRRVARAVELTGLLIIEVGDLSVGPSTDDHDTDDREWRVKDASGRVVTTLRVT